MPEARSRAHYRMVWKEEIGTLTRLKYAVPEDRFERIDEIKEELMQLVELGAESLNKPDICPDCGNADYYCGYRRDCPSNIMSE